MKHITIGAFVFVIVCSPGAIAHETGSHTKVMGTVRSIDAEKVVVKTTDGREQTIRVDDETGCADQQGDASCSAVKPGERVVVNTRGKKGALIADEIRFSSGAKKTSVGEEQQHPHQRPHTKEEE